MYAARVCQPRSAPRPKCCDGQGLRQPRAVSAHAGFAHGNGRLAAITSATINHRDTRTHPGVVVDHDVIGHTERAKSVDDSRVEIEEVVNLDSLQGQPA